MMMTIDLKSLRNDDQVILPKWAKYFEKPYRLKSVRGGRGSGKTWTIAHLLVARAMEERTRIAVAREFAVNTFDSAKQAIEGAIYRLGYESEFAISEQKIRHRTNGSRFSFHGLERNPEAIRGLEGVNICWIEEAQYLSEKSAQILLPTMFRTPDSTSEMWFSWNPENRTDWVWQRFVENLEDGELSLLVNFDSNGYENATGNWISWFPKGLETERKRSEKHDPDLYRWIWLGQPADEGIDRRVLPYALVRRCVEAFEKYRDYGNSQWVHAGFDVADTGRDYNAVAVRNGPVITHAERWRSPSVETVQHIHDVAMERRVGSVYYDSGGVGAFVRLFAKQTEDTRPYLILPENFGSAVKEPDRQFDFSMDNKSMFMRRNAQLAWSLRMKAMATERLLAGDKTVNPEYCLFIDPSIPKIETLLGQLAQPTWKRSTTGKIELEKSPEGTPSPDLYDAVALAFSYDSISGVVAQHD